MNARTRWWQRLDATIRARRISVLHMQKIEGVLASCAASIDECEDAIPGLDTTIRAWRVSVLHVQELKAFWLAALELHSFQHSFLYFFFFFHFFLVHEWEDASTTAPQCIHSCCISGFPAFWKVRKFTAPWKCQGIHRKIIFFKFEKQAQYKFLLLIGRLKINALPG